MEMGWRGRMRRRVKMAKVARRAKVMGNGNDQ
jgi:hypothetical protein